MMSFVFVTACMCLVAVTISATFGFEGAHYMFDNESHVRYHLLKDVVRFNVQMLRLNFDGNVPVAQVIGRTHEVMGCGVKRTGRNFQKGLWCRFNSKKCTVLTHQHVLCSKHFAPPNKNCDFVARRVSGMKATFLSLLPF